MKRWFKAMLDSLPDTPLTRLIRRPIIGQLLRFGISTCISASMTVGLPILLHEVVGIPETRAVSIAFTVAFIVNFVVMRTFVFGNSGRPVMDLVRYGFVNLTFRFGEVAAFNLLFVVFHLNYILVLGAVLVVSSMIKFFTYKLIVFAPGPAPPTARDVA